jgi:hypothetical protein
VLSLHLILDLLTTKFSTEFSPHLACHPSCMHSPPQPPAFQYPNNGSGLFKLRCSFACTTPACSKHF